MCTVLWKLLVLFFCMLKPQGNRLFLASCLWSSSMFLFLTLHLYRAQTPLGWEVREWLMKGGEGEREREGTVVVQDNYRKIGVCSHHWPASHSPPSAAHSLGWQPAPCRSCWPLSPPGWRGRGEKQCETHKCIWALVLFSHLYYTLHVYLVCTPQSWSHKCDLLDSHVSIYTAYTLFPEWVIFGDEAIDQQWCCKQVKTGQLSVWCCICKTVLSLCVAMWESPKCPKINNLTSFSSRKDSREPQWQVRELNKDMSYCTCCQV